MEAPDDEAPRPRTDAVGLILVAIPFVAVALEVALVSTSGPTSDNLDRLRNIGLATVLVTALFVFADGATERPLGAAFAVAVLWIVAYPIFMIARARDGSRHRLAIPATFGAVALVAIGIQRYVAVSDEADTRWRHRQAAAALQEAIERTELLCAQLRESREGDEPFALGPPLIPTDRGRCDHKLPAVPWADARKYTWTGDCLHAYALADDALFVVDLYDHSRTRGVVMRCKLTEPAPRVDVLQRPLTAD